MTDTTLICFSCGKEFYRKYRKPGKRSFCGKDCQLAYDRKKYNAPKGGNAAQRKLLQTKLD